MTDMVIDPQVLLMLKCKHVEKYFPDWEFVWENDEKAHFSGWVMGNGPNWYQLRLELNPQLPEVCPELFVWEPIILPNASSGTINELLGHSTHTRPNGPDGRVQICFIAPNDWDASISFLLPLLRGALWINAYEAHLATGRPISDFFPE